MTTQINKPDSQVGGTFDWEETMNGKLQQNIKLEEMGLRIDGLENGHCNCPDDLLDQVRQIIHDELLQIFDFTRTSILSGNMEGVEPRKTNVPVHSGESEYDGSIKAVHQVKEDKIPVPYLAAVKVKDIYESASDKITQKVLLEDSTSSIILTIFSNNELKPLEKGKTYNITKLKTNIYNDSFSLNTTGTTTVIEDVENVEWLHDEKEIMVNDGFDLI